MPKIDLTGVASDETIHHIIVEDESINGMLLEEKESFARNVKKRAPKL